MPTGLDALNQALLLLGYTNGYGEPDGQNDAELYKRGTAAVRQVYRDLCRIERRNEPEPPALRMDRAIPLSAAAVGDVMPYGVAMFLAQSEGSGDSQALFAAIYDRKRAGLGVAGRRKDILPKMR